MSGPCGRRDFLWAGSAVAAAAASAPSLASAASALGSAPPGSAGDFEPGTALGPCHLLKVLPVDQGALPFVLEAPDGASFVVELHVHDPAVPGIARAGSYDVFLRNGGSGRTPTHEAQGLGAMALAAVVAARQAAGRPIPELATIAERWSTDPPPLFR